MKYKKSMIILMFVIVIFSFTAVNASSMNDTSVMGEHIMQIESAHDNTLKIEENNEIITDNPKTFAQLDNDINESQDTFEILDDYTFNNESDGGPVVIAKSNFTINGNNHVINGNRQSGIFNITGNNVTINNLVFINGNSTKGGAIYSTGQITLNNITFISNYAVDIDGSLKNPTSVTVNCGGAIANYGGEVNCNNTKFIDNYAESSSAIYLENAQLNLYNSFLTSNITNKRGQIYTKNSDINLYNVDFVNITSAYACALYLENPKSLTVVNSRFVNLTANITAGAIAVKTRGNVHIKGCEFINTKSFKNAGAVNVDYIYDNYNVSIQDTLFENSSSMIGGAYIQLGGNLHLNNSSFISNRAVHEGGAAYLAFLSMCDINNCTFSSNVAEVFEDYSGCGGAVYSDYNVNLMINHSRFLNNSADIGNGIYAVDTHYTIVNSIFANNTNAIFTFYDVGNCSLDNNDFNNESIITNETHKYASCIDSPALKYEVVNNTINVTDIPIKFDLRDWGWTTSVKEQGRMGSCWTFGLVGALESAILKKYGVALDLSEGNMFHNMLRYFDYGCTLFNEGGFSQIAASYLVSWYGPAFEEADVYDEVGKLSPYRTTDYETIHVQDVIFLINDDVPNATKIKSAIINYGALAVGYWATHTDEEGYLNLNTSAQYTYDKSYQNHVVSLIGWDDNYSKDNFLVTPPGDGAWIIKNSWGTAQGDEGIFYISYYDKSFVVPSRVSRQAVGIILDNTIPYNKNYGHDYVWSMNFVDLGTNGAVAYSNFYEAEDDDLIAGVGTYFKSSDVNYTVKIYINGMLKLTQEGLSPFAGFHTIKLNEYVPVKKGDKFNVEITSNAVPVTYSKYCRVHYTENLSFLIYENLTYEDMYSLWDAIACLKAYTVADDSKITDNKDLSVNYGDESFFAVRFATEDGHAIAGATVEFTINGKTISKTTDNEGIAKLAINEVPGTYVITTVYNNQTYQNNITVKLDSYDCTITGNKNIKVDYGGRSYFAVKVVSSNGKLALGGKSVIFVINGKTSTVKTDENGIAKIKITEIPKKYTVTTIFNGKTYKNTVTVKQVLTARKITVKKTAKKFTLKAKLKINGKVIKGKSIKFKINGKTYKVKTNKNGIARKTLKKNVIKKLKKGKTYTVKVIYLKDTIKTTVKVK